MAVAPLQPRSVRVDPAAARRADAIPVPQRDLGRVPAFLMLLTITGIAALIRLWNSTGPSFRLDEGFTVRMAAMPLTPIYQGRYLYQHSLFQTVATDVHPPGYLLFMHFWMVAFGANLAVIRLPSEIAGILAVPAIYLLGSILYSRAVGLVAGLIAAVSPFVIWHSQEARMYTFLMLFTVLSTYTLVVAVERRARYAWVLYCILTVLAIYTQYYAFLIVAAQVLWVLTQWRRIGRTQVVRCAVALFVAALAYIPWVIEFLTNYHGASNPDLTAANLYTPLVMLSDFLFGNLSTPITSNVVAAWPLLVPLALAIGTWGRGMSPRGGLLWLEFLLPISAALLVTYLVKPILSERYLIVSMPALYILIGVVVAGIRARLPRLLLIGGILGTSLAGWTIQETSAGNPASEDYRTPVQYIEHHLRPGDIVGLDAYFNQDAYSYYSHINAPVYELPFPNGAGRVTPTRLASYLQGVEAGHTRLWVIYYLETNSDPHNIVHHFLDYHTAGHTVIYGGPFRRNDPHYPDSYRNVQLVLYRLIPTVTPPAQIRPETEQELRALTHISPTVADPFASPFDAPGSAAPLVGQLLSISNPNYAWHLPASTRSAQHSHLILFDPTPHTARVRITASSGTQSVTVPAYSNLDLSLDRWYPAAARAALRIQSTRRITAVRTTVIGHTQWFRYAYAGTGTAGAAGTP